MPLFKASDILALIIDYQKDIFTINILDEMELYHSKLVKDGLTDKVINQAQHEVVETIIELSSITHSFPANAYFRNVPDRFRLAIQLRFAYFEKSLESCGDELIELPTELSLLLQYGLIRLWDEKMALSSRHRNN